MTKYKCIEKCYAFAQLFERNHIYDLQPDIKHKYLQPVNAKAPVEERAVKVNKPDGLGYDRMTEVQLVNMEYPLGDLRDILANDYQIVVAPNTQRRTVINKYVEARAAARK